MSAPDVEYVPMDDDDKELLRRVYYRRRNLLFSAYAGLIFIGLLCSFRGTGMRLTSRHVTVTMTKRTEENAGLSKAQVWLINLLFIEGVVMSTGVFLYLRSVYPLRKDITNGLKEKVPHTILRKQYLPLTDQCYIWIDAPATPNYEVPAEYFTNCAEGDTFYLYRAARSKLIFQWNGRYELL